MSHQPFAQGHGGGGGRRSQRAQVERLTPAASRQGSAPPGSPRPASSPQGEDIPDRHVSLRRIGRLFSPYRLRLGLLLGLIVLGSILGVASPFLLREAVNKGIISHDLKLLIVAGAAA